MVAPQGPAPTMRTSVFTGGSPWMVRRAAAPALRTDLEFGVQQFERGTIFFCAGVGEPHRVANFFRAGRQRSIRHGSELKDVLGNGCLAGVTEHPGNE